MHRLICGLIGFCGVHTFNVYAQVPDLDMPERLVCTAKQTAGFHDWPHNEEAYEPVVFFESDFKLRINRVLMRHMTNTPFDGFLTLLDDEDIVELQCAKVRGTGDVAGLSCSNSPPSDLLLLNLDNLRYTRTSIGGWTFAGANESSSGDSIYVEYGRCEVE